MSEIREKRRRRREKGPLGEPSNNKRIIGLVGVLAVLFVIIGLVIWIGSGGSEPPVVTSDNVIGKGRLLGDANAAVAIKDYSDFSCSHCRDAATDLTPEIIKNYVDTGKVSFEFVPVGIISEASIFAAQGAMCADDQGKFWEYHDKLFERQGTDEFDLDTLSGYAEDVEIDNYQDFRDCMLSSKYRSQVEENNQEFQRRGARGTPTFIVGTELIGGSIPFDQMQTIIDTQLSQ
ncbi:MAG: DsbA family protein [Ardenticatenaceae bacterium]